MASETINITSQRVSPANQSRDLRILQLTDCHLHSDPDWKLAGINTQTSFDWVLSLAEAQKASIDLLLLTGDLVHDASVAGYNRLRQQIQRFGVRACCLPGNHDKPAILRAQMCHGLVTTPPLIRLGNWLIILLDSTLPDSEGGHLSNQQLEQLDQTLCDNSGLHVLIALHHHPVPINSAWMDKMSLDNPASFFSILDRHDSVKGVIWGHIHQTFESEHNGIQLLGTPSTCIQFADNQDDFGLSMEAPGFRWLDLAADGRLRSGVERVAALPPGLDLKTAGY